MKFSRNKILDSIVFSVLSICTALLINRGYFIIDSVVGNEYIQIREASQFRIRKIRTQIFNTTVIKNISSIFLLIFYFILLVIFSCF